MRILEEKRVEGSGGGKRERLAISSFCRNVLMPNLPNSFNEARLAIVGEFTVSCGVLNLIPVIAFVSNIRRQYLCAGLINRLPRSQFPTIESRRS